MAASTSRPSTRRPALPCPHLHAGNAEAHGPDDPQVLLDEGLQLGDAAALRERGRGCALKAAPSGVGPHQPPASRAPGPWASQQAPAGLPPPCRCWRRGRAARSRPPRSCSSCQGPRGRLPRPSGSTRCPASPASCCCHSNGTAARTRPRLSPDRPPLRLGLPHTSGEVPPCATHPPPAAACPQRWSRPHGPADGTAWSWCPSGSP